MPSAVVGILSLVSILSKTSLILLTPGPLITLVIIIVRRHRLAALELVALAIPSVVYFALTNSGVAPLFPKSLGNLIEFLWINGAAPTYLALRLRGNMEPLRPRTLALVLVLAFALPCLLYFLFPTVPE